MGFWKRLRTLIRNESGNTLAIGAAAMPIIIGAAALAVDTVHISLAKRELQRAADSAAIAGVWAINHNPTSTGSARATFARNGVTRDLQVNNDETLSSAAVVENAPTVTPGTLPSSSESMQKLPSRTSFAVASTVMVAGPVLKKEKKLKVLLVVNCTRTASALPA